MSKQKSNERQPIVETNGVRAYVSRDFLDGTILGYTYYTQKQDDQGKTHWIYCDSCAEVKMARKKLLNGLLSAAARKST